MRQETKFLCFFLSRKEVLSSFLKKRSKRLLFSCCAGALFHIGGARGAEHVSVILDWFVNANHAALFAAKYCGAYARQGLDVEIIAPADPETPPKLVAAGQADLAVTYQTQLNLMDDHGLDLVRVATLIDRPLNTLMALPDSGIRTIADLKGKRIGLSVGGVEEALLGTMLAAGHLTLADVTLVKVNFDLLPPLLTHRLDAVIGAYRNYEQIELEQMGLHPIVFAPEANGVPPYDELILVAARAHATDDRLKKFIAALREGTACLRHSPQAIWTAWAHDHPELDNALNQAAWQATLPVLAADPAHLDARRYLNFQAFLKAQSLIGTTQTLDRFARDIAP